MGAAVLAVLVSEAVLVGGEVVDQLSDLFVGLRATGLYAFEAADGETCLIHKQTRDGGFGPLLGVQGAPYWSLATLWTCSAQW